MKRTNKKGFTIVELVVVIAIIAILAAVLIPTFSNLIKRANVSSDQQLVRNLNTALIADAAINGKHQTMHDAVEALKASGFDVAKINDSKAADNEILWDSKNDLFCYLNGNTVEYLPENKRTYGIVNTNVNAYEEDQVNYVDLFRVAPSVDADSPYSTYLYAYQGNEPITTTKGLDVGDETVSAIAYTGNGTAQNVVIRTNGGALTINAATDDVKHYGMVKDLTVTAVNALNCYHEFGYVGNLDSFGTGKFVAEASAVFHQSKEEIEDKLSGKTSELKDGSQYGKHYFDPEDGVCEIDNCEEVDPDHPNTHPSDSEEGIEGVKPKIKIVEGENGALNLVIDKSEIGDYADQVAYYEIVFSTKLAVISETYGLNEEYVFELNFDSRAETAIPYIGWSCDYPSNMGPDGSTGKFKTSDDIKYELISDSTAESFAFKNVVWIVADSIVQKAMIENHNISVNDSISCVFSYSDYNYHYYINLTNEEYQALCDVYGESKDVFKAVENENGKYEIDVEAGVVDYEDYSNYTIKAYKSDGTLLGKTTYKNAYSQWKNGEDIVVIPAGYEDNSLNNDEDIADTLAGNSNTFGYYQYVLETRGKTTFWTDKVEE